MFQIMRHQQTRDKHGIKRKLDVGKAAEGNCAYAWRLCMSIMQCASLADRGSAAR